MTVRGKLRTVIVWNEPHVVTVFPESDAAWVAVGLYGGKRLEARARTEEGAVARWLDVIVEQGD